MTHSTFFDLLTFDERRRGKSPDVRTKKRVVITSQHAGELQLMRRKGEANLPTKKHLTMS